MENTNAKATWISIALATIIGVGLATTSAYVMHLRFLQQMHTRMEIEEIERRRRNKRSQKASRQRKSKQDLESCSYEISPPKVEQPIETNLGHSKKNARVPTHWVENVDSSTTMNNIPLGLPQVQTHCSKMLSSYSNQIIEGFNVTN
jgi:hypothetical protein